MKQGWELKALEEIASIYNGNSINAREKKENYTGLEFGTPYIATKDVGFDHQINYHNGVLIPEPKSSEFKLAPEESVLICAEGGSAGRKVAYNDRRINFGNKLFAIVPRATADGKYLYYCCISKNFYNAFSEMMTGIIGGVSLKKFKTLKIDLPPLKEQKRIVEILDEAFTAIDKSIANTEKNFKNARKLFESYLDQVFSDKGEVWVNYILTELLEAQPRNGWSPPAIYHSSEGTPVLTLSSVTGFNFKGSSIKYTSAPTKNSAHYWVENGDLLITRSNTHALVGHVAIADNIHLPTIYPDLIMRMKVDSKKAMVKFLYYQLRSPRMRELISNSAGGASPTMKKISKPIVQNLPLLVPSLKIQRTVVGSLDKIYEKSQQIEQIYQQKLANLKELKQSLLQKAFTGELTKDFQATSSSKSNQQEQRAVA